MLQDFARPRDQRVKQLHGWDSLKVSHYPAKFCGHRRIGIGDIMVLVCHVISNDHVIRGSSNFMGRSLSRKVSVKSRDHRHCGSGDIPILVCCVSSQEHVIKVSCGFAKLGGVKHSDNGDIFLVFHVISQDHVIQRSCDFMGGESHHTIKFGGQRQFFFRIYVTNVPTNKTVNNK